MDIPLLYAIANELISQKLSNKSNIRYNVKYVFFEVLSQIEILSEIICEFILKYIVDEQWSSHILKSVVWGRKGYIEILRNSGIIDCWMQDKDKRMPTINLIASVTPDYQKEDIDLIKKYMFQNKDEDRYWSGCFYRDINEGSDELFELRLEFYERYPDFANQYLDVKAMLKQCEIRTIRLLAFMLKYKINNRGKTIYQYEEEFVDVETEILVKQYKEVIAILLPYVPKANEEVSYSDWSGKYSYRIGIERACVQLLKKANSIHIKCCPEEFVLRYKNYMGTGNALHNEILLDALFYLPDGYADMVIEYICLEFDRTLFEDTSGNGDKLLLAKKVISKYSAVCSDKSYDLLERKIINYIDTRAKDRYENRINYNREKHGYTAYWDFWGHFQKDILEVLPNERISEEAKNLLIVLVRKSSKKNSIYYYDEGHSGTVSSPIAGKELNIRNWQGILTNSKIRERGSSHWKEGGGGFIESSLDGFSRSFNHAVSEEPDKMIRLVLSIEDKIPNVYIDTLFSGVAYSTQLNNVSAELIERMIDKFSYDYKSHRAISICRIIQKRQDPLWSTSIIKMLKDIAVNHENPAIDKPDVTNNEDKEMKTLDMIESNAINSARGEAAEAIGSLLWQNSELLNEFHDTIEKLIDDENPAVRFASLYTLWPAYNIERNWASEKIILLYKGDFRMAGFYDSKNMFFRLYKDYKNDILKTIQQCYESNDKRLVEIGGHAIVEMYILHNEFRDLLSNIQMMRKEQAEAILHMLVIYFGLPEYNEYSKKVMRRFIGMKTDIEIPWTRLFYDNKINLERDKDFLIELMSTDISRRTLHAFTHYLEEEGVSLIGFKDIILSMCHYIMQSGVNKDDGIWGIQDELSKLIFALYDETSDQNSSQKKEIANKCLKIWDCMFENQIGSVRALTSKMMEM